MYQQNGPKYWKAHLIQQYALFGHARNGEAAVQHLLVEPPPRPFPGAPWVYLQGIQHHC